MIWLADITFLRPLWLLGVPVIALLAVLSMRQRAALGDWSTHIEPHLMAAMERLGKVDAGGARRFRHLPFWGAAAICVALSGPALERGSGQTFRNLDGVVFVVDVSPSMTQADTWPAALTMVQAGLSALGTKPAALIVFAGDSYPASSLTLDHVQLSQTVALLDDTTVPDRGTRPEIALMQARALLERSDILAGDVVFLTDGGGFGPAALNAARDIAEAGGRLLVVRAGPASPEFEAMAELGNGTVYGLDQVEALMRLLGQGADKRLEAQEFQLLFFSDYGRYLLLLALIPIATLFRKERV